MAGRQCRGNEGEYFEHGLISTMSMITLIKLSIEELADHTDSLSDQQAALQLHPPTPVVSLKHMSLPSCLRSPLLTSLTYIPLKLLQIFNE